MLNSNVQPVLTLPTALHFQSPSTTALPTFDFVGYISRVTEQQWTVFVLICIVLVIFISRFVFKIMYNYCSLAQIKSNFSLLLQVSQDSKSLFIPLQQFSGCSHEYHFCGFSMVKEVHIPNGRKLTIAWDNLEIENQLTGQSISLTNSVNLNFLQRHQLRKVLTGTYTCLSVIQHGKFYMYVPVCMRKCQRFSSDAAAPGFRVSNKRLKMYP